MSKEEVRDAVARVREKIESPLTTILLTIDVETVMEAAEAWLAEQDAKEEKP